MDKIIDTKIDEKLKTKGEKIFEKLKTDEKLTKTEKVILKNYISEINSKTKVNRIDFVNEYRRIFNDAPISISNKLRDEKGKKIKLKNNKFKVISEQPSEFMSSQFVALFRFKFRTAKGNFIIKTVPGYSPMLLTNQFRSEDDLIKLVYKKALAAFLTSIGYGDGSLNAQRRLSIEIVDKFWITYVSYEAMINHNIAMT